jgi:hypothetical protein
VKRISIVLSEGMASVPKTNDAMRLVLVDDDDAIKLNPNLNFDHLQDYGTSGR